MTGWWASAGVDLVAQREPRDLKALAPGQQVSSVRYCRGVYEVALKDDSVRSFKEFDLGFKTDTSTRGPDAAAPALVPTGRVGDRAFVIFAGLDELKSVDTKMLKRERALMTRWTRGLVLFVAATALLGLAAGARAESKTVILSTTTSTLDSGLLDVLVPLFERNTGYTVKTISVGTGQALALAARGEADVTLAHAPALEKKYVAEGKMQNRRLVMYNDFVIIGPEDDPAKIKGEKSATAALKKIAGAGARFVSRGDKSGTNLLEQALWKDAGVTPAAPWYIESGQGMGATLGIADDRKAYTLSDRGTMLAFAKRIVLKVMVEGDRPLLNLYSVMEVNPANGPRVNSPGGKTFADFMLAPKTQAVIKTFGVEKYGQPLFVPIAGKKDEDF